MYVITGATGHLGSQIVERLLERVPAESVGVSVRDATSAASLAERGVRVRTGDFTEPATLAHAFEGAQRVLVVSASIRGDGAVTANRAAVDAARAAGAERILYTSHQAASKDSLFPAQLTHAATEQHLAGLGVPFTALRNGFYASTLGFMIAGAVESGQLVAPADGPVSWTDHADLAEVGAIALA
jgi:NAD(P)H dehydrogenase (quinone)